MRTSIAILLVATLAHGAYADVSVRNAVAPMMRADDDVCSLLRAQSNDRCKRVATGGDAEVYLAGSKRGINRVVLVIDRGGETLVAPAIDLLGEDCSSGSCVTLVSAVPTVTAIEIDGRPATVLDLVSTYRASSERWETHSVVGCGQTVAGAWKCSTLDLGRCDASLGPDGGVTTSCGARGLLSLGS